MLGIENEHRKSFTTQKDLPIHLNLERAHPSEESVLTFESLDKEEVHSNFIQLLFSNSMIQRLIPMLLTKSRVSDEDCESKTATVTELEFKERWQKASRGLFQGMDTSNVFVAGGLCLGILCGKEESEEYLNSDIDLFIHGVGVEEADLIVERVIQTIFDNHVKSSSLKDTLDDGMIVVRTTNSVTLSFGWPFRNIQIVLRIYQSPAEILLGFDVDCCSVGFDFERVWATPRAIRSIKKRYNLVNPTRRSTSYELRLLKYSKRGFGVMVPHLDGRRIDSNLYQKSFQSVQGLARLLLYDHDSAPQVKKKAFRAAVHKRYEVYEAQCLGEETASDYSNFYLPSGPGWGFYELSVLVNMVNNRIYRRGRGHYIRMFLMAEGRETNLKEVLKGTEWMVESPMRQGREEDLLVGSFHPLPYSEWERDAYDDSSLNNSNENSKRIAIG